MMAFASMLTPAFGEADLSNCEREQIQFAGSIQPHGCLLVVREPDLVVVQASANSPEFLGVDKTLLGSPLSALGGDLLQQVRARQQDRLEEIPTALRCHAGLPPRLLDGTLHRLSCGGLVVELEPAGSAVDLSGDLDSALRAILGATTLRSLGDEAARIVRAFTGYDRVMVYRFDEDGHGEVFAECRRPDLEALFGNRYPASDIPQIARRLYERNRVRVLADITYTPVPLEPRQLPLTGRDLDMSLCCLRSSSPIHIKYLQNMGVTATLVASVMVGGRLWGLIACHHYVPRFPPLEMRAVCELLAEAVGTRIAALESFFQAQAELSVRRLEQRMIEAISREGDWRMAFFDQPQTLLQPLGSTGAALLFEGQVQTAGEVPGTQQLREIWRWLDWQPRTPIIASASLALDEPRLAGLKGVASGLIATPLSVGSEYLVWFRPEQVRTVTWGGNPFKPVLVGDDPGDLSPRRSFAKWHQEVKGTCEPWTKRDLAAARLIGETVADVVLQFRSVRLLIAQDQLNHVRGQVVASDLPVVITDCNGLIEIANGAFEQLLGTDGAGLPQSVMELASRFVDVDDVRRRIGDVLRGARTLRAEFTLRTADGRPRSLLIRADPVYSDPSRVLGYVFLFSDLSDRKAAKAARQRFQEGIAEGQRLRPERLDGKAGVLFKTLLGSVLENAQLAALEIADGVDEAGMPQLYESIRASVERTAAVLEMLVDHANRAAEERCSPDSRGKNGGHNGDYTDGITK